LLIAILSACSTAEQSRKTLTVTPQNTAVLAGDTVILECEVQDPPPDSRILWAEYITFAQGSTISDNEFLLSHPNRLRYAIIHDSPTMFHLQISNVQMTDGGAYMCSNSMSGDPDVWRGEVQLVVLDAPTNCTGTSPTNGIVIEGHTHTIECVVNYQGAFAPTMYWSGPDPYIFSGTTLPTTVWSGLLYTVQRSMNGGAFQLKTNFTTIGSVPEYAATNVPTFTQMFSMEPLTVFWGPMNTYADPIKSEYFVGDVLTCHTDAMPDVYFMWQNLRNLDVFPDSPTFTITPDLIGTNQTMRCQVQNIIYGFVYSDNVFVETYVPIQTTPITPAPTTPSTPPPPESPCNDITGHWRSENPDAELYLEMVANTDIGEVRGLVKNGTDTIWVEVIGTARRSDWSYIGLTSIWPLNDGITGMSAECHRCYGEEVIIMDGMLRSVAESVECGAGSTPSLYQQLRFVKIGTLADALKEPLSVWKPTKISKHMGIQLK